MHQLSVLGDALPYILQGALVTIAVVVASMLLGLIMGVPLAVIQVYGPRSLRFFVGVYVWFFRGVPVLTLLFLFYFGLFQFIGLNLSAFTASCVVLGMTSAAYQSQIFRGAILSIPPGQMKAARALGMRTRTALCSIILPQALRLAIPAWSNEYSILLKDSALCFVLGTPEIMARAHFVASRTGEHLPLYVAAGVLYFVITLIGVKLLYLLEKKVRIRGHAGSMRH